MNVELISCPDDVLGLIDEFARVCYDSNVPKRKGAIAESCIKSGHLTVIESANFVFKITGVSRACTHQLVRQRMAGMAQRSQRYVDEDAFEYVVPPTIANNPEALESYSRLMEQIQTAYAELKECVPKEDARFVLPNACTSSINVVMNLHSLMHFLGLRLCTRSQWEIRNVAQAMAKATLDVCPELKPYLVPKCEQHSVPFCEEGKCCGRHKTLEQLMASERV